MDRDVMLKPPRNIKRPMITKTLLCNVLMSAVLIVTGTLWIFWREVRSLVCTRGQQRANQGCEGLLC